MVKLADCEPRLRQYLEDYECPVVDTQSWAPGPPLAQRRVALVSSAGLRRRDDQPFTVDASDYRIIPVDKRNELVQDHISAEHDRTGYLEDLNTILPLDRLVDLSEAGEIASVAEYHYSFMGATDPTSMQPAVRSLASVLKKDGVNALLFCPV